MTSCGVPRNPSACRPDACPITSCMSVCSSPDSAVNRAARSASSGVHANSLRTASGVELSFASRTLESDTDLLP
ncbi:hypothetical protein D3C83_274790 [compost metagenome]